ncbi:hypothetical protein BD779DRAFT_1436015 [Infundibulicybe gibba]|nr:hypothetical protein BD779DRAFT_1436015 [Infundibulicybe gibba]
MTSHHDVNHTKSNEGATHEPNATPNSDPEADSPANGVAGETAQTSGRGASIRQIITQLGQLEDSEDSARLETDTEASAQGKDSTAAKEPIPIKELFNFQDDTWAEIAKATSIRGLEEEMELYDLVDLDAVGEDDNGVDGQDGSILDDEFIASSLNLDS